MVAAAMSADTGVGPAIASPSQDCNGNWADFAAGTDEQQQADRRWSWAVEAPSTPALTDAKSTFPKVANIIMIAIARPEVTDPVDEETPCWRGRHTPGCGSRTDEQVGRQTDTLQPTQEEEEESSQDEHEHRGDEEIEVGEEPALCPGRAPWPSEWAWISDPTKVMSRTKLIDNWSTSRPAELELPAGIQFHSSACAARSSAPRPSMVTKMTAPTAKLAQDRPVARAGPNLLVPSLRAGGSPRRAPAGR